MQLPALILLGSTLVSVAADEVTGRWEGSIQIPGRECALIVYLERADGKDWSGSIIIPGLGVKGASLSEIAVKDFEIEFTINGVLASERIGKAKFRGHLVGADRLTGEFLQARDLPSGEVLWNFETELSKQNKGWVLTKDRAFNDPLLYHSSWREYPLAAADQQFAIGAIFSSPLIVNGVVYFGSTDGYLYALE